MAQQTAVEWFINEIESKSEAWENASIRRVQISIYVSEYLELKRQANQKFEEQVKKAYNDALAAEEKVDYFTTVPSAEQYYTKTYKE